MSRLIETTALLRFEAIDDHAYRYGALSVRVLANSILRCDGDGRLCVPINLPIRRISDGERAVIQLLEIAAGRIPRALGGKRTSPGAHTAGIKPTLLVLLRDLLCRERMHARHHTVDLIELRTILLEV